MSNIKKIIPFVFGAAGLGIVTYSIIDIRRRNKLNYLILQKIGSQYTSENPLIETNVSESQLLKKDCDKFLKQPIVIEVMKKISSILGYMNTMPYVYSGQALISDLESAGIYRYSDFYCFKKEFYNKYKTDIENVFSKPIKYLLLFALWDEKDVNTFKQWLNTIKKRYIIKYNYLYDDVSSTPYKVAKGIYNIIKDKNEYTEKDAEKIIDLIKKLKYKEQFSMVRVILNKFLNAANKDINAYETAIRKAYKKYDEEVKGLYLQSISIKSKYKQLSEDKVTDDGIQIIREY